MIKSRSVIATSPHFMSAQFRLMEVNMLNIAVCDDNEKDRRIICEKVSRYVKNNALKTSIMEFQDGEELVHYIQSKKAFFEIIFLDIYMNLMDGMETAKKIRESDTQCNIIFLTTSISHAVESYDVHAAYYLLKPIDDQKLYNALQAVIEDIAKVSSQYVIVNSNKNYYKLFFSDILYVESRARVLLLHTKQNGVISIYSKLNDYEAELKDYRFLRCHKSFLINMDYVLELKDASFVMENDQIIPISNGVKDKKKIYMDHLLSKL